MDLLNLLHNLSHYIAESILRINKWQKKKIFAMSLRLSVAEILRILISLSSFTVPLDSQLTSLSCSPVLGKISIMMTLLDTLFLGAVAT